MKMDTFFSHSLSQPFAVLMYEYFNVYIAINNIQRVSNKKGRKKSLVKEINVPQKRKKKTRDYKLLFIKIRSNSLIIKIWGFNEKV